MQEMQRLIQPGSDDSSDFVGVVIAAMKEHLDADISFLAEFQQSVKVIRKFAGDGNAAGIEEGVTFPLKETYCHRVATGELPNLIQDARNDERVKDLAITRQLNIGTYVSVPITLPDDRLFGTLCCLYHHVEPSIQPRDVRFMRVLADILGNHLGDQEQAIEGRRLKYDRIEQVIANQDMRMVFQPIVNISTQEIVGAEALARFDAEPRRTPDIWFAEALEVGLGQELEMTAVQLAVAQLHQFPESAYLSVNVSPDTLQTEALFETLSMIDPDRIVVEVTEHAVVKEYEPLMEAILRLHNSGSRLAVDDVGAGYSGLGHIIRIAPKIMKLDVSLTRGIYQDVVKQALATSAVAFASRVNIDIVAEGIETAEDALALQLLGVRYGQGYYFAKPGDLPLNLASGVQ
ncbi:MAG: EAL domain-containing protein [Gammaproteobacteria bacterium]